METMSDATWIWYPGDFEIWLGNRFNNRRTERGAMFPPFWKQDSHWATVEFRREVNLSMPEKVNVRVDGKFNFSLDGHLLFGEPSEITVPDGRHILSFKVFNQAAPPSIFLDSPSIRSGNDWMVSFEDKIWIDEEGVAHGSGTYVPAGCWNFCSPDCPPSLFRLPSRPEDAVQEKKISDRSVLVDFGRETFGYLVLQGIRGEGEVGVYYGESAAEALDREHCETLDRFVLTGCRDFTAPESKAFRYVLVDLPESMEVSRFSMLYEYLPCEGKACGSFECSDETVNRIWQTSAYTMELTTREFMLDGIKRDRWTWSGDAIQSYLMNYYLGFDCNCVKRTIRQLRGKDPVTSHINTILDYSFYWFISVRDYYRFSGDADFVREIYPRMKTMMDYVLGRLDDDGFAVGKSDDWVFVDWVDFPMHKRGVLCFEQFLLARSLEAMAECARVLGDESGPDYAAMARHLLEKTDRIFWSQDAGAYMHALEPELNPQITRFPSMFAIIYGYASEEKKKQILQHVLLNPDIPAITTPYMKFYEMEALCSLGKQPEVLEEIRSYWGGMLREGATSFWEKYDPSLCGEEHLAMYGRPFGKSLCHAWGASPAYLLGRYFLGVEPTSPGYASWTARPSLGGLAWMKGSVPTPYGCIRIEMDAETLMVTAPEGIGHGKIIADGKETGIEGGQTIEIFK